MKARRLLAIILFDENTLPHGFACRRDA